LPDPPRLATVLDGAAADARDVSLPVDRRLEAIRLVDLGPFTKSGPVLFALLDGREPSSIQQAAFALLREHREPEVGAGLVRAWPVLAPALRPTVVNLLVYRPLFQEALVSAIETGFLPLGQLNLDLEHRRQLLRRAAPGIRARAAKFTSDEEYSNRKAVVDTWLGRMPATGDSGMGRVLFERICAQCHRAAGLGFQVGPELTGQGHRSVEDLLSNILDPNMAMNPAYVALTAELADGESETGILMTETADSVSLVQAGGRVVTVPRARLKQLRSEARSLMPDGLEEGLTAGNLRDLIAFLQEPAAADESKGGAR
jgi:putative heme-binding domain-containing protein